jgi:hypothetical protein
MNSKLLLSSLLLTFGIFISPTFGQIEGGNAYLIGDYINIAIDDTLGKEGTAPGAGFHNRTIGGINRCGLVADPTYSDWDSLSFDGDFYIPGSPENGWGIEIDTVNYGNNHNIYQIPRDSLHPISHTVDGDCITVEWQGSVEGVVINIKYHLQKTALYYTTEVTLYNTTDDDLTDVYYYRNFDPDNNANIGGAYITTNTIVSQTSVSCNKALVSATSSSPHESYIGLGAIGENFRVTHGGFFNRYGSDIWNGAGGLENTLGAIETSDKAISLAYKTDIAAGDSVNFTFVIVIGSDQVENALIDLYYLTYETSDETGGELMNPCYPALDTAESCPNNSVILTANGPGVDDYVWVWSADPIDPGMELVGSSVIVNPIETTVYTAQGSPISGCFTGVISKSIVVEVVDGPLIGITDPGLACEEFDLTTLVFEDLYDIDGTVSYFFSEMPDSASQTSPIFAGPMMDSDDEVWLMIGDTVDGCFDAVLVEILFTGEGIAGPDSAIALCGIIGTTIDINDLVSEDAYPSGTLTELTASGAFDDLTHLLEVGDLSGTFEFSYLIESVGDCPEDEALIFVEVYAQPNAELAFESGGNSSEDGIFTTCLENLVNFEDLSTIPLGGVITEWNWDFGDGYSAVIENPSHVYSDYGTYVITLTVSTEDGCTSSDSLQLFVVDCLGITQNSSNQIVIYPNPSSDYAIIDFGDALVGDNQLLVHNALGQQVFSKTNITDKQFVLNVNELGKGIYYVSLLESTTEVFVAKLIVQ